MRVQMRRNRHDSLIGQVVAANVVLVVLTAAAALLVGSLDSEANENELQILIVASTILLCFAVNLWMLQKRFRPLERLLDEVERIDPAVPSTFELPADPVEEIDRLAKSFKSLLQGVADERSRSGQLVLRAQEQERRRVARDLHDEVNQALTAILLRLEALAQDEPDRAEDVAELKRLTIRAMDELLSLAHQLRPTALDDQGLLPALRTQLEGFGERTGVASELHAEGDPGRLGEEGQTVIYRVTQEALSNAARHAQASRVEVSLAVDDTSAVLSISDDGIGFDPSARGDSGMGLEGMAERARLSGGELDLRSAPGAGTALTLRMP